MATTGPPASTFATSFDAIKTGANFGRRSLKELARLSPPQLTPPTSRRFETSPNLAADHRTHVQADVRRQAQGDIESAVAYYRSEAGSSVANDFIDALEGAIAHLCAHPETGSLRFAYDLEIPSLRSWALQKFPYLIFYIVDSNRIDIWRVLHARRDIPNHLVLDSPG